MSTRTIKLILMLISACFFAAILYISALIVTRQEALREVSRYNTAWLASQALVELTRLEQRISAFSLPDGGVDKDEIELRFDILLNRVKLLRDGEFQDFIGRDPEWREILDQLTAAVALAEPLIQQIERPGAIQRALSILTPLDRQLALLASAANRYGAERVAEDQSGLMRLHLIFSVLSGGLALFGIALITFLGSQNRKLERAREDLSQQNARFDVAINNMPHGLAMFDNAGRLIVGNRQLPAVLGVVPAALMVGANLEEMAAREEAEGQVTRGLALRKTVAAINDESDETPFVLDDGRTIAISRGVMAEGGRVCIFEDVTARIQAQAQREQLEEKLRQSQKMEAVGQLTGGIAHDFNNLLTVILGNAELLAESPDNPAFTTELSRMISEAAERGADLTQKLLAFGRRQSLKLEYLNLADTINGMVPLLRRAIGEHIDLQTNLAGRPLVTLVDRALFESSILNLVVNARDAMPQGGVLAISIQKRYATTAEVKFQSDQEVAVIKVTDTGTGMSPGVVARVFEPFFTTKEVGKGSGLGLSMVYGFAEQSGGQVLIESEEGQGTSITIVLPLTAMGATSEEIREVSASPATGGSEKVLVVEDDPQVLQFVASQLRSLGYAVTPTTTAIEALLLLEQGESYDALFSDVVLPKGMSGIELANRVRALCPELKVLLTSGYSEDVFQRHGRPAEDMPLLKKPYKRAELAQALRDALDNGA